MHLDRDAAWIHPSGVAKERMREREGGEEVGKVGGEGRKNWRTHPFVNIIVIPPATRVLG
jgi:hypothetical protein